MIAKLVKLYFFVLPLISFALSRTKITEHGYLRTGITKNNFIFFYLGCLAFNLVIKNYNFYLIHICRRACECLVFRYKHSRMKVIHFLHGLIYYVMFSLHIKNYKQINLPIFLLLNILQSISHYFVFKKQKYKYSHYFCEILIYLYLYFVFKSNELYYNVVYLVIFALSTIEYREKLINNL